MAATSRALLVPMLLKIIQDEMIAARPKSERERGSELSPFRSCKKCHLGGNGWSALSGFGCASASSTFICWGEPELAFIVLMSITGLFVYRDGGVVFPEYF